jgi:biotin transport system substrate-specific component
MNTQTELLVSRLWPARSEGGLVRYAVLAIIGSLLVAGAAQVTVPMWPVPMTLQTLAVLAVGAAYGSRLGAATLGLYALEGAAGLPFFAGGKSGIFDAKLDYLLPAGSMGYVVGFILAAYLVGKLVESGWANTFYKSALATLAGAAVLYVPGLIWLAIWAAKTQGFDTAAAIDAALNWGLYPFIVGDILKAIVAGLAVPAAGVMSARKN